MRRRCSRVKEGVERVHFDRWPRIDVAIESYRLFRELRDAGVIPDGLRFQVGLPFPSSAMNAFKADFAADYPRAEAGYEDLVARELPRLFDAIPPEDLAIQWDCAYETQDIEGVLAWTNEGAWERFAGPVTRLTRLIPEETLVGYHLCYGTFPEWPMYEARDYQVLVRMANFAVAESGRTVDWLHLAGPRYLRSEDRTFFRPLVDLEPRTARVFLGIVLPLDGSPGLRRRHQTASRYMQDFGVAMYCGFGRQPGPGRRRDDARARAGHPAHPRADATRVRLRTSRTSSISGFSSTAAPHIAISAGPGPIATASGPASAIADRRHRQRAAVLEGADARHRLRRDLLLQRRPQEGVGHRHADPAR